MKWIRFQDDDGVFFGRVEGDTVKKTGLTWEEVLAGQQGDDLATYLFSDVKLLVPVERPSKIVAVGQNYMDHCREQNVAPPERPILFTKFTTSLIGPGDAIEWQEGLTEQVDFEVELAVVIGKEARRVSEEDALDYVFGYTVANDVSARDLQYGDKQWVRGKSLDTFCPMGPCVVTADEIPDPQALNLKTTLNEAVMQDSHTGEMIFNVRHLIAFCSNAFTLLPGDVLLTGTPNGVGKFREPPVFMQNGDTITVEIEGIGSIINPVRVV
ncbi:fumarylacetoacetate hydrolase family protein [Phototrophicus methaneseepsis]|uniref:Fumarylacetoacetate hydrolase family protein n=1 Tax=Phototrophicus methaneseepsis TaxID=2710758 RepID=A0A7S8ED26_9CHLR|nr:fumarylacetoacetate hydrolase family protein [Phototrophicus methaneseepsis]QPC84714.1 fumarylacetoacetate hydrolase family protein [Phototrophicus methaneseepsis]